MGQKGYIIGFLMIFIFSFAFMTFAIDFATDNNAALSIADDPTGEISGFTSNVESETILYILEMNDSLTSFTDVEVDDDTEITRTGGVFKDNQRKPQAVFGVVWGLIKSQLFGNDAGFGIIFGAIFATILLIGSMYIWKLIKGGNPD